jgi:hypothetical protein
MGQLGARRTVLVRTSTAERNFVHQQKDQRISLARVDTETLLAAAGDADWWDCRVRTDADDQIELELTARVFNTLVTFEPPQRDNAWLWLGIWEDITNEGVTTAEEPVELEARQLIDVVPHYAEQFVLEVTIYAADYLSETDDPAEAQRGLQLRSEAEQAEAHSAHWRDRAERRYGDFVLYELPDDVEIDWERGEDAGRPALLAHTEKFDRDGEASQVLVAPDMTTRWRRSTPGGVGECGEYLPVHEVLGRVPASEHGWVREQTALALGETLARIRQLVSSADAGRGEPAVIGELAEAARHAHHLAAGMRAEPFRPR